MAAIRNVIYICVSLIPSVGCMRGIRYSMKINSTLGSMPVSSNAVRSLTECAVRCSEDIRCATFIFDKGSGSCSLHTTDEASFGVTPLFREKANVYTTGMLKYGEYMKGSIRCIEPQMCKISNP